MRPVRRRTTHCEHRRFCVRGRALQGRFGYLPRLPTVINRMPAWIGWGAGLLAWNAGLINAVGLMGFSHEAISHISGVTTQSGLALSRGDLSVTAHLGAVILAFFAGAVASGAIIGDSTLRLGRRYGVALGVESALLFFAMLSLRNEGLYGQYLASAACGLQNALATTYSGAVVRTTHVTGVVTDLRHRHRAPTPRRGGSCKPADAPRHPLCRLPPGRRDRSPHLRPSGERNAGDTSRRHRPPCSLLQRLREAPPPLPRRPPLRPLGGRLLPRRDRESIGPHLHAA